MSKNLPKRYVSEEAVKKALNINSFRNVSKEKILKFVSMLPDVDREVAIAIINQFPVYADFGKCAISHYSEMCENILEKNKESEFAAIYAYQTILDSLSRRMESESTSEIERKAITEDMIEVAAKIADINLQNQRFLDKMSTKFLCGVGVVVAIIGTAIGINSQISTNNELPQVEDNDSEDYIEM